MALAYQWCGLQQDFVAAWIKENDPKNGSMQVTPALPAVFSHVLAGVHTLVLRAELKVA